MPISDWRVHSLEFKLSRNIFDVTTGCSKSEKKVVNNIFHTIYRCRDLKLSEIKDLDQI